MHSVSSMLVSSFITGLAFRYSYYTFFICRYGEGSTHSPPPTYPQASGWACGNLPYTKPKNHWYFHMVQFAAFSAQLVVVVCGSMWLMTHHKLGKKEQPRWASGVWNVWLLCRRAHPRIAVKRHVQQIHSLHVDDAFVRYSKKHLYRNQCRVRWTESLFTFLEPTLNLIYIFLIWSCKFIVQQ